MTPSFEKISTASQANFATSNRRFKFNKRSQLLIGTHDETLPLSRCASAIQIVHPLQRHHLSLRRSNAIRAML
jgi:hypothetical protein